LVSRYSHVFVQLSNVIVTLPLQNNIVFGIDI